MILILRYKLTGSSFKFFNVSSQTDSSLIREIENAYLARYIPVYGDRISLRRYCLDKEKQKDNSSRISLLEKLRKNLRTVGQGCSGHTPPKWLFLGPSDTGHG